MDFQKRGDRMMFIKRILFFLTLLLLIFVTACGAKETKDDDTLNIMFLSEIPVSYEPHFVPYISEIIEGGNVASNENLNIDVQLFPVSHDKLTIEIVSRNMDIFIVDEALKYILLDPYGLHPLDPLRDEMTPSSYEEFIMTDEDTGEPHLYAVPLDNDSTLVQDLGIELPSNLIAVIVKSSSHKEIGLHLLKEFL